MRFQRNHRCCRSLRAAVLHVQSRSSPDTPICAAAVSLHPSLWQVSMASGYFALDPLANPLMYNWNMVYFKYCGTQSCCAKEPFVCALQSLTEGTVLYKNFIYNQRLIYAVHTCPLFAVVAFATTRVPDRAVALFFLAWAQTADPSPAQTRPPPRTKTPHCTGEGSTSSTQASRTCCRGGGWPKPARSSFLVAAPAVWPHSSTAITLQTVSTRKAWHVSSPAPKSSQLSSDGVGGPQCGYLWSFIAPRCKHTRSAPLTRLFIFVTVVLL